MSEHKYPYHWYLKDGYPAKGIEKHGLKVFGTFICGGGSTMGYKLAGYEHLGGVEIDPKISAVYKLNNNPKYLFTEDIRQFNKRTDLPDELFNLDILDGSPPCSTFSMAGSREKAWGKEKQFREGQSVQTLDDLVFIYCDTIIKLQPKAFILENVKGIIQGNAKVYSKKIVQKMTAAGYVVQVFCLNAASMGVPQKRERVFFIGYKKELNFPKLKMDFDEKPILFSEYRNNSSIIIDKQDTVKASLWYKVQKGSCFSKYHKTGSFFNDFKLSENDICPTLTADPSHGPWDYELCRMLDSKELIQVGSYPLDYNFEQIEPKYLIGMSVPPVMTAQIAHQIYLQWFEKTAKNQRNAKS
jgi:DNA (cytosine-5)-methyltransferase 1